MDKHQRPWGATPWTLEKIPHSPARAQAAEVVIIGAGFTGASTAYHLARRGIAATIFEAGSVGEGASGRSGGLVLEGTAAGPLEQVSTNIDELETLISAERIDCGMHLPGCWEIAHGSGAKGPQLPWTDNGQPVHIAKTIPGGVVEPARMLTGILDAALKLGAAVEEHSAATQLLLDSKPGVVLGSRTIYAKHVVVAVNAWMPALLAGTVSLYSSLTFACATAALRRAVLEEIGLGEGIPFYTADMPYLWGRTMDDGRVIFGSGLVFGSPEQLEHTDVSSGRSQIALRQLHQRVRNLHPRLKDVEFSASWGGPIAFTPDTVPFLGRLPSCRNIIVAGAYSGHGVALSVRIGKLIANAIADGAELPAWGSLDRKPAPRPGWQR